jgi:hypothetical protein
VVYPWAVECAALHAAGWRSAFSNAEALSVLLAARAGHQVIGLLLVKQYTPVHGWRGVRRWLPLASRLAGSTSPPEGSTRDNGGSRQVSCIGANYSAIESPIV